MTNEILETYGNNPIQLCHNWYHEAEKLEPNDPEAVCIATADRDGRPSARMVLIKEMNADGFKFHTNVESQKGEELLVNPYAALCFYWKSTRKQIRIEGLVEQVSDAESDAYFKTRPVARQIGAWASQQSRPYKNKEDLEKAVREYTEKFTDTDHIPRPPNWAGFRLKPQSLEFWIGNRDRLHERFLYTLQADESWTATWLYP